MRPASFIGRWIFPIAGGSALLFFHSSPLAQCTRNCGLGGSGGTPDQLTFLYSFLATPDAANPSAALVEDSWGNFYGTTVNGGANGNGTIFELDTAGKETILYSFQTAPDGMNPQASLFLDLAGNLYGTTAHGGRNNNGIIFKLDTTGKETILYSFFHHRPNPKLQSHSSLEVAYHKADHAIQHVIQLLEAA